MLAVSLPQLALAADCEVFEYVEKFSLFGMAPPDAKCRFYQTTAGTKGTACFWTFRYRDPSVEARADALWEDLTTCRSGTPLNEHKNVNHPDTYGLREWARGSDVYALSIKDKVNFGQTLIFLRIEPGVRSAD